MKILAFMQNTWANDAPRVARMLREAEARGTRNALIARLLFSGCPSGKRLYRYLGKGMCDSIIWDEASPVVTGKASKSPGFDMMHMKGTIILNDPDVIVTFGHVAKAGIEALQANTTLRATILHCVHPTSRMKLTVAKLMEFERQLRELVGSRAYENLHEQFSV